MDVDTVRAKMMAQVASARESAMAAVFAWTFEIEDLILYVTMRHRRKPDSIYLLRVAFDDFPRRAPSYIFVDRHSKDKTSEAWPPKVKQSNNPAGICTPGTREFHENYHRNDAAYPWDSERYTVLSTLCEIHRLMERGIGG
jgi:hypothetical protein